MSASNYAIKYTICSNNSEPTIFSGSALIDRHSVRLRIYMSNGGACAIDLLSMCVVVGSGPRVREERLLKDQ